MSILINISEAVIQVQNVKLLKDVNFKLNENEFIFLSGKIGSGKTSFLKTIYAELPVNKGNVLILDYNLKKIKNKEIPFLRRQIGYIFQDFKFLNDRNIYENFKFVLEATNWTDDAKIDARIKEVVEEVEMSNKISAMPYELSGGEIQRLALARAILNNPKIILADEPTGNLDEESVIYVTKKLAEQVEKGCSVIFVTHNKHTFDLVPNAKIVKIENKTFI